MKGMVFTEFLELVDERFSFETTERLIEMSHLPSEGTYTSVGTYDHQEMITLVSNLSTLTGTSVADLLKEFGRHLFRRFLISFPTFFEGIKSSMEFLPRVDSYVHLEVRKLFSDVELPSFSCTTPEPGVMIMAYRSKRNLPDLAEGLILSCIDHFGESLQVRRETGQDDPPETRFIIMPK
ncbi:MAG: heme NO-binding domain-containing protein [bacterium]